VKPQDRWYRQHRKGFGCKTPSAEVCWCNVCVEMEQAWEEAMQAAKGAIDEVRHPVSVRREQKPEEDD